MYMYKKFLMKVMAIIVSVVFFTNTIVAFATATTDVFVITAKKSETQTRSYDGGWGQSWYSKVIYDDSDLSTPIIGASLPAGVGFTILDESTTAYYIDTFSSSTVHLAGVWVAKTQMTVDFANCRVGDVITSCTVYGGEGSNTFESVGTITYGDVVTIIAQDNSYYFVEFNSPYYLRKRGWVPTNVISNRGSTPGSLDLLIGNTTYIATVNTPVYHAPGSGYYYFATLPIGQQFTIESYVSIHNNDYAMISYIPSGSSLARAGYIVV